MFPALAGRKNYEMSETVSGLLWWKEKKKPKGLFDGQLYVFACDQNSRGEAEIETNTRPNQSNVVFGPMKRKKGSVLSGNDGYKGEGYGWKSLGLFTVVTGNLNPGGENICITQCELNFKLDHTMMRVSFVLILTIFFFCHFILWKDCMPLTL